MKMVEDGRNLYQYLGGDHEFIVKPASPVVGVAFVLDLICFVFTHNYSVHGSKHEESRKERTFARM